MVHKNRKLDLCAIAADALPNHLLGLPVLITKGLEVSQNLVPIDLLVAVLHHG